MLFTVYLNRFPTVVCIAVQASVFACVICADVDTLNTAAFRTLILILLDFELVAAQPFQPLFVYATGMRNL